MSEPTSYVDQNGFGNASRPPRPRHAQHDDRFGDVPVTTHAAMHGHATEVSRSRPGGGGSGTGPGADDIPPRARVVEGGHPILVFFRRVGRVLRFIAGVDERVMDRMKPLRAWYASLGAAVLMTGVIAAFSMWFAVQQATSVHPALAVFPALIWFVFIVVMDRWIISSRAGEAWQRFILLVTRGTLAILFGIVIAEPLVLRVFENQIIQQVQQERSENLSQLRASYLSCNPDPAGDPGEAVVAPADCVANGYDLGIGAALAGQNRELSDLQKQYDGLAARITENRAKLRDLQQFAMDECAGVDRPGTTGDYGEGINCLRNAEYAADFEASVDWQGDEARLAGIREKITKLQTEVTGEQKNFTELRDEKITERLADQPQVDDQIGLLQRMEVLHQLGSANLTLFVGVWLVRLLFIAIDTSPVLMKIASGRTAYDRWVDDALGHAVQTHERKLKGRMDALELGQDVQKQVQKREAEKTARQLREQEIADREREYRQTRDQGSG